MNDKLKWFGRYLECEFVFIEIPDKRFTLNILDLVALDIDSTDIKLILKEIKNISEEDAIECIRIESKDSHFGIEIKATFDKGFSFSSHYKSSKIRRNHGYCDNSWGFRQLNSAQIDFLRSKGYAIGIPKEYYITEEDLKDN